MEQVGQLDEGCSEMTTGEIWIATWILWDWYFNQCIYTVFVVRFGCVIVDIVFEVDDGTVRAHRALLTSRSDVMAGMFNNDFMEKSAKLVTIRLSIDFNVICSVI